MKWKLATFFNNKQLTFTPNSTNSKGQMLIVESFYLFSPICLVNITINLYGLQKIFLCFMAFMEFIICFTPQHVHLHIFCEFNASCIEIYCFIIFAFSKTLITMFFQESCICKVSNHPNLWEVEQKFTISIKILYNFKNYDFFNNFIYLDT